MSLDIEAQKLALTFSQLLLQNNKNDINELTSIYHEHFLNSRIHLSDWYSVFNTTVMKNLTDNKVNVNLINVVKDVLTFELNLQENHLFKIRDVLANNNTVCDLKFSTDYFINSYKFMYDYKNYFLTKHLYSVLNNCKKIIDVPSNDFSFQEFFKSINSKSLTGTLFTTGKKDGQHVFKIPLNLSTPFMFWNKGKLIGIMTSIDKKFDKQCLLNNFINLHILYDKNPKDIQENLRRVQSKKNKSIISKLSSDKIINQELIKSFVSKNIEFVFDLNILEEYDGFNKYETIATYLMLIESDINNNYEVPEQVNHLVFYEIVNQLGFNDIIDKNFREKTLIKILSTFKDYNSMIFNLSLLPERNNYLKDFIVLFYSKIRDNIQAKRNNETFVKNYIFSKGINSKDIRDKIFEILSNKNIINMKEFFSFFKDDSKWISDLILLLHSNHVDSIIMKSINGGLNDKQIVNSVLDFDKTIDNKKIANKIYFFREQKTLKDVLDMNLVAKK